MQQREEPTVARRSTRGDKQTEIEAKYARWFRVGFAVPGKSQAGLARHLGVSEPVVSKMVNGSRAIHAHEIEQAALYFGIAPPGDPHRNSSRSVISVPVLALALEGYWRESNSNMPLLKKHVEFVPHTAYPAEHQYAVEVGNPSLGVTHILCVDIKHVRRNVSPPDILHVERRRDKMGQILIRRLERVGEVLMLVDIAGLEQSIPLTTVVVKGLALATQTMLIA